MFGIPGMLWWGMAAGIPILIHLFARQRYKKVSWAAMEFLLRAFKKTRKRIRLEHLLLLLLRILAILFFILALADPHISTGGVLGGDDARREIVLILDDSFSMGVTESDGRTPFSRAKEQALALVRSLRRERLDTVTLIKAGHPATIILKGAEELDRVTSEIERLEIGDGTTDYVGAFRMTNAVLADLEPGAEIFLLSDLQKVGFVPPASTDGEEEGAESSEDRPQELLQSLMQQIRSRQAIVNFVAPAVGTSDNVAVTRLLATSKAAITGTPTTFAVEIKNFGTRATGGTLQLFVDGGNSAVESVAIDTLAPGGWDARSFRHTFTTPGSHYVEAVFTTDNLEADNRRRLSIEVRDQIKVLTVDGTLGSGAGDESSFYLTNALVPQDDAARPTTFSSTVIEETALEGADLSKADLLVLANVALLSPNAAKAIRDFVQDGGGLMIFLGDKTNAPAMNNLLWQEGAGVLPGKIGPSIGRDAVDRDGPTRELVLEQLKQPPFAYFSDPAILPYVSLVPFYRFHGVTYDDEDTNVRLLGRFTLRGDPAAPSHPAVLEKRVGRGRCILIATSADDAWHHLPVMPLYLPFIKEMAYFLTRPESAVSNLLVGSSFYMTFKEFVEKIVVSRGEQALRELKPLPREGDRGFEITISDLEKADIYRLLMSGMKSGGEETGNRKVRHLAVNVDTMESDLSRVGEDFIIASFPGSGIRMLTDLEEAQSADGTRQRERVWWWLLAACLAMLALDTALSQWFGRRARAGGAA